jgi:S-adenosylmethionine/arginine decarboxylase-like enzyme
MWVYGQEGGETCAFKRGVAVVVVVGRAHVCIHICVFV